ncbi:hypothetical protein JL721_11458 [Aureococcus anophagefferens]|nr:hypothetical protein JL721_11458 [Aureococcus anophagefferens]
MSSTDFLFCAAQASGSREVGGDEAPATPVDRDGLCHCEFVGKRFPGADKYLGGVRSSSGAIYAIPGHAKRVLQIVGDDVRLVGPAFEGKYKWLRVAPATGALRDPLPRGARAAHRAAARRGRGPGGVARRAEAAGPLEVARAADPRGRVYAIPQSAERVLRITPSDAVDDDGRREAPAVELVGPVLPGRWKFTAACTRRRDHGVRARRDGRAAHRPRPAEAADGALEDVSLIGDVPAGGWKWHGGCVTADGCVWGIPSNSASVLKIAPKSGVGGADVVATVTGPNNLPLRGGRHRTDDKYKYLGGVVAKDGRVYCIPSDADRVLRIDPATSEATYVGLDLSHLADGQSRGQNKWQNGYCAPRTAASTRSRSSPEAAADVDDAGVAPRVAVGPRLA